MFDNETPTFEAPDHLPPFTRVCLLPVLPYNTRMKTPPPLPPPVLSNVSFPFLWHTLNRVHPMRDTPPVSPYQDLEKATVLQECRVFSDSNVVTNHPRRCGMLITKLLYILNTGETLSSSETTEVNIGHKNIMYACPHGEYG